MFPSDLGVLIVEEAILDALDVLPPRGVSLPSPGRHGLRRPEPERVHRRRGEGDGLEGAKHGACARLSENFKFQSTKPVVYRKSVRVEKNASFCVYN